MTEREFLTSDDPARMLRYLTAGSSSAGGLDGGWGGTLSGRKLRLFASARQEHHWNLGYRHHAQFIQNLVFKAIVWIVSQSDEVGIHLA